MSLAQDRRRQKRREDLADMQLMLGMYRENFSPEAKAREQSAQQQALAAQYSNQESVATRALRERMLGTQADQSQFNLDRDRQLSPLQLEQLRNAIGAQALDNTRSAALLPFVVPEAQTRLQDAQNKTSAFQKMAPLDLQRAQLENQARQQQNSQAPLETEYARVRLEAAKRAMQEKQQMLPIEQAGGLAQLNQFFPADEPIVPPDVIRSVLQNQMVDSSIYSAPAAPSGPVASDPFTAAYNAGLIPEDRIGPVLNSPGPNGQAPIYHSLFAQMQNNLGAYPEPLQLAYRYMNDPSVSPHATPSFGMYTPEVANKVREMIAAQQQQEKINQILRTR